MKNSEEHIDLLLQKGNSFLNEGKYDETIELANQIVNSYTNFDIDDQVIYNANRLLTFSYISQGMANEAIPYALNMLNNCSQSNVVDKKEKMFYCNNSLALLYCELSILNEALEYGLVSFSLAQELDIPSILAMSTGNLGLIYNTRSEAELAFKYLLQSAELSEKFGFKENLANVLNNTAVLFHKKGDLKRALTYYQNSLKIFQELDNDSGIARCLGHIGAIYFDLSSFHIAKEYFQKALVLHENLNYMRGIGVWNSELGNVYQAMGDYEKSLEYYQKAKAVSEVLGDTVGIANMTGNIGKTYFIQKNYKDALSCYKTAAVDLDKPELKEHFAFIIDNIGLWFANPENPEYDKEIAEEYLLKALVFYQDLGDTIKEYTCYYSLYILYDYLNDSFNALNSLKQYIKIKENVQIKEAEEEAKNIEFRNKVEEQEKARDIEMTRLHEKENLLHNILPSFIANRIIAGEKEIAEYHENVSIIFTDIVGFTAISQNLEPAEVVSVLNELYSTFDTLAAKHSIEKIKTIGDAYMAACGIPNSVVDHKEKIAAFAFDILRASKQFILSNNQSLKIRIGIHSGNAVAGVIGNNRFTYDLWGDAVNTASRMQDHGLPDTIHVSEHFIDNMNTDSINIIPRGLISIKGKGMMHTYFIEEKV